MVLVSDHGFNTDERLQPGFNLVSFSAGGSGGHHVITKRRLLMTTPLRV